MGELFYNQLPQPAAGKPVVEAPVADTHYADNSGDLVLTLQMPSPTGNANSTEKITQVAGP